MILWIDDLRDPINYNINKNYIWAKDFDSAKKAMSENQTIIKEIHFDNDLGEIKPNKEGKHLFSLLEYMLYNGEMKKLKRIYIHTSNSSAANSMMSAKNVFLEKYHIKIKRNYY